MGWMSGTGLVYGQVTFTKCKELSLAEFQEGKLADNHCIPNVRDTELVSEYKKIYAWHCTSAGTYVSSLPCPHVPGRIGFGNVANDVVLQRAWGNM